MAKKSAIEKNNKRKRISANQAIARQKLKEIADDVNRPFDERIEAMIKLSQKPRNSSKVRIKNRCSLTGRPRAYHGYFDMSRIMLRELALAGLIPGLKKSSW